MSLLEQTIAQWQRAFDAGESTCESLCKDLLRRITEIDVDGPGLRSIVETNPDALALAQHLDEERRGKMRGPLHGIPVVVKDSIDTADRMMTTCGSLALVGNYAPHDATVVRRLRDAGAVLLAKTNMSEWGYMRSTRACSGWSSRGGQTRNPYVLDRSPLGSSSGSAVAVAANLCVRCTRCGSGWFHCPTRVGQWSCGPQTDRGTCEPLRWIGSCGAAGYDRPPGSYRHRRCHSAKRNRGNGSERSGNRRSGHPPGIGLLRRIAARCAQGSKVGSRSRVFFRATKARVV